MDPDKYLESVLSSQELKEDSDELNDLRARKAIVQKIIEAAFAESSPTIRYGGSYIKGTLIKESYDLDIICYFGHDDTKPGDTLEDIYNNVKEILSEGYYVEPRTSALRLRSKDADQVNFHIDVVPGRFVEGDSGDAFLYQSSGEKKRLKTNLDKHIEHIKGSGHVKAIKLAKLWKIKYGLSIRTFPLELLVIKLLEGTTKDAPVSEKLLKVWKTLKDNSANIAVEDPANPEGNDLSEIFNESVLGGLSFAATQALSSIEQSGWGSIFGEQKQMTDQEKIQIIQQAASTITSFPKPHSN